MQELIGNAWRGWMDYISDGKYAVLFLGVLCWLWLKKDSLKSVQERRLFNFSVLAAVLVIFPVSAAALMLYQTRFYDYKWLWSLVPVTIMIAYGSACIYIESYEKHWKGKLLKPIGWIAFWVAVVLVCSGLTGKFRIEEGTNAEMEKAAILLDELTEDGNNHNICLWAPKEIMEHIRALSGNVELLYGRNMWDAALNGYAYDTYDTEVIKLYEWMESLGEPHEAVMESLGEPEEAVMKSPPENLCVQTAVFYGVNRMVFPDTISGEILGNIESAIAAVSEGTGTIVKREAVDGYYIFRLD